MSRSQEVQEIIDLMSEAMETELSKIETESPTGRTLAITSILFWKLLLQLFEDDEATVKGFWEFMIGEELRRAREEKDMDHIRAAAWLKQVAESGLYSAQNPEKS